MYAMELDGRHIGLDIKAHKWGKVKGAPVLKEFIIKKVCEITHNGTTVKVGRTTKNTGYYYGTHTTYTSLKLDTIVEIMGEDNGKSNT